MRFNSLDPLAPAFLLVTNINQATGTGSIRIEKYDDTNVVNYVSLESYLRQTFSVTDVPTDFNGASPLTIARAAQIAINRASNDIARRTGRGTGNHLFVGPNTTIIVPAVDGVSMHTVATLDWLADNECLLLYSGGTGQPIDNGFVWAPKDDGTVDVNAQPAVAGYGQFVRVV